MQNQDPTQPMDPSAMVSQLATISQVGQSVQTNTTLNSLLTEASLTQAEIAVGSQMTSSDGTAAGQVQSVNVSSAGAATATLTDGQTIPFANGANVQ
jgi:flagellar basal-body rod modification protein FlgD